MTFPTNTEAASFLPFRVGYIFLIEKLSSQNDCSATAPIFSEKLLTNLAWKSISIIVNESRCRPIDGCPSEYKFYVIALAEAITSFLCSLPACYKQGGEGN